MEQIFGEAELCYLYQTRAEGERKVRCVLVCVFLLRFVSHGRFTPDTKAERIFSAHVNRLED